MKTIISNNDGFKYLVELQEVSTPTGYAHLKFSTECDDGGEQTKFEIFLTDQQLANLKDIL